MQKSSAALSLKAEGQNNSPPVERLLALQRNGLDPVEVGRYCNVYFSVVPVMINTSQILSV